MPSFEDVYPSKSEHLKASDLKAGMEFKVSIDEVLIQEFEDEEGAKTTKLVLKLVGKDKSLVLNKTNASVIASAFGNDYTTWPGKEIYIYSTTTQFGSQTVPCIRVRPALAQAPVDDIPF